MVSWAFISIAVAQEFAQFKGCRTSITSQIINEFGTASGGLVPVFSDDG